MGVVHLATDPAGRAVALKVLRAHVANDDEARRRLGREVATLRRVRHPQVAEVLDADVAGAEPYLVTRFVPGRTLEDEVRAGGPLPAGHVARIGRTLASALAAIHAAGVVHRDLKPANVMLVDGEPVLIDFGIAHVADESRITRTGLVMGTPGYLSPELIYGGAVTPATDWWAWGATLAFAATGRQPFGGGPIEVILERVRRGQSDLDGVEPGLRELLIETLTVESDARLSYGELMVRLDEVIAGVTTAPSAVDAHGRPVALPNDPTTRTAPPGAAGGAASNGAAIPPFPGAARPRPPIRQTGRSAALPPAAAAPPSAPASAPPSAQQPYQEPYRQPYQQPHQQPYQQPGYPSPQHPQYPPYGTPPAYPGANGGPAPQYPVPQHQQPSYQPPSGYQQPYPPSSHQPHAHQPHAQYPHPYGQQPPYPHQQPPYPQGPAYPWAPQQTGGGDRSSAPGRGGPPAATPQQPWQPASSARGQAPHGAAVDGTTSTARLTGTLAALLVALAAVAAVAPGGALVLAFCLSVLSRLVQRSSAGLQRRREELGGRRSTDMAVTVVALPWRLLMSLVMSVVTMVLPVLVATSTAFIVGALASQDGAPHPTGATALFAGMLAGVATAWWGPGGWSLRTGSRAVVRSVTRNRGGRIAVIALCALVVLAAWMVASRAGYSPDWAPFPPPESLRGS
jgi:serine/threonine protein kinase